MSSLNPEQYLHVHIFTIRPMKADIVAHLHPTLHSSCNSGYTLWSNHGMRKQIGKRFIWKYFTTEELHYLLKKNELGLVADMALRVVSDPWLLAAPDHPGSSHNVIVIFSHDSSFATLKMFLRKKLCGSFYGWGSTIRRQLTFYH